QPASASGCAAPGASRPAQEQSAAREQAATAHSRSSMAGRLLRGSVTGGRERGPTTEDAELTEWEPEPRIVVGIGGMVTESVSPSDVQRLIPQPLFPLWSLCPLWSVFSSLPRVAEPHRRPALGRQQALAGVGRGVGGSRLGRARLGG